MYTFLNNDRYRFLSIGLPLDVQLVIGDGSSSKYTPKQTIRQFSDSLIIDESSKLSPPAEADKATFQVLLIRKDHFLTSYYSLSFE